MGRNVGEKLETRPHSWYKKFAGVGRLILKRCDLFQTSGTFRDLQVDPRLGAGDLGETR